MHYKVLIADDNKSVLENFKEKLSNHLDIEPKFVDQSMDVLSIIQKEPYEYAVVVLDYHFALRGGQNGPLMGGQNDPLVRQANWHKIGGVSPPKGRFNQTTFLPEPCASHREMGAKCR